MLSPNSLLQQGRYRIVRDVWETGSQSLYEARDTISNDAVLVREITSRAISSKGDDDMPFTDEFERVSSISNRAILGSHDHFIDSGSRYIVSGPSSGQTIGELAVGRIKPINAAKVIRGLKNIVENLIQIASADPTIDTFHTDPASLLITADGDLKYVYFGNRPNGAAALPKARQKADLAFAFMPLEAIWDELDLVSQKAISHSYSQASLEILESSPDFRTDIAVLASFAYFLTTGVMAAGALERSIEVLDGNPDPLVSPHDMDRAIPLPFSDIIVRAMSLKRQDRSDGLRSWLQELSGLEPEVEAEEEADDVVDDADILELPVISTAAAAAAGAMVKSQAVGIVHAPEVLTRDLSEIPSENHQPQPNTHQVNSDDVDSDIFSTSTHPRSWFLSPAILAALLFLAVGGGGAWYWITSTSAKSVAPESTIDVRSTVSAPVSNTSVTPAQPVNIQVPAENAPALVETSIPVETADDPAAHADAVPGRARPAAPATKSRLSVKPSSDGPAGSKKKVTVDDLISDN